MKIIIKTRGAEKEVSAVPTVHFYYQQGGNQWQCFLLFRLKLLSLINIQHDNFRGTNSAYFIIYFHHRRKSISMNHKRTTAREWEQWSYPLTVGDFAFSVSFISARQFRFGVFVASNFVSHKKFFAKRQIWMQLFLSLTLSCFFVFDFFYFSLFRGLVFDEREAMRQLNAIVVSFEGRIFRSGTLYEGWNFDFSKVLGFNFTVGSTNIWPHLNHNNSFPRATKWTSKV